MKALRRQVAGICAAEDGEERFLLQEQVKAGAGDQRPCHGPIARAGPYRFESCPHRSAAAVHDQVALPQLSDLDARIVTTAEPWVRRRLVCIQLPGGLGAGRWQVRMRQNGQIGRSLGAAQHR